MGGTKVIIDKFYVGGAPLILQYGLIITPSCHFNRQVRSIKMIQETEKQLKSHP